MLSARPLSTLLGAAAAIAVVTSVAACYTDAPTYASCSEDIGCAEGADGCFRVLLTRTDGTTGDAAFCTRGCSRHDECPGGGLCLQLVGDATSRLLCYQACTTSGDCYSPLVCTSTTGASGDPTVCMP